MGTTLDTAECVQGMVSDNLVLVVGGEGFLENLRAMQTQSADNIVLTQDHQLVLDDASQDFRSTQVLLGQVHNLVIAECWHTQAADPLSTSQEYNLALQSVSMQHRVDGDLAIQEPNGGNDMAFHAVVVFLE